MRLVAGFFLCFAVATVFGCGSQNEPPPAEKTSSTHSTNKETAVTASIVCSNNGARVLTPEVATQPDGVHFVIDNRTETDSGYAVELPNGDGTGGNTPVGKSRHVEPFPPGTVRIGCHESPDSQKEPDYKPLEVVDENSVYKPTELECEGGMSVIGVIDYAAGAEGEQQDPVEMARRFFSNKLRADDTVETAGYPEQRADKTVRVVRDGQVVATVEYWRESGGWLQESYRACESFNSGS